jgi:hypothetical protein
MSKLLFVLLLSILLVVFFTESMVVNANPFPSYPSVKINSPINSTYTSDSLTLDIAINTKFDNYTDITTRTISYSLDGQPNVVINNVSYKYFDVNSSSTVTALAVLSNLTNGEHKLNVQAKYQYKVFTYDATPRPTDTYIVQNYTSKASVFFSVAINNGSPSPTPTVPEFSWLTILPLLISVFSVAVVLRHRKLVKQH